MSFPTVSGHGTVLRMTNTANGDGEFHRTFTPAYGTNLYKGFTAVEMDIDLHGNTIFSGDQSVFGFDQSGWQYVSLSSYVVNGQNGWQHITIPMSALVSAGLNVDTLTTFMVFRWYNTSIAMTIDVDNITLTGGPYTNYTQPSLPSKGSTATWNIQGVDTMKWSKDTMSGQHTQSEIDTVIALDTNLNATHIAVDCPYDDYTSYSPAIAAGYKAKFISSVRANGKKVWHRQHWNAWEGDYGGSGFTKVTPTSTPTSRALGTAAGVLAGTDTSSHLYKTYNYIKTHASEFATGDIFTPVAEVENGGVGSGTTNQFATYQILWQFMRDSITVCNEAFNDIGLGGQIFVGFWGNSGYTLGNRMDEFTIDACTYMAADHYVFDVPTMTSDMTTFYGYYGKPIIISEWSNYPESNPSLNALSVRNMYTYFKSNTNIVGVNYWNDVGGSNESILNTDYSKRQNYYAVENYFDTNKLNVVSPSATYSQPLFRLPHGGGWAINCLDYQILSKSDGWNQNQTQRLAEYDMGVQLGCNYVAIATPYDNLTKYVNYVTDARSKGFKIIHRSHWNAWQGDNGVGDIATSTSLTSSGTTATCVTSTAHGLTTGQTVSMNGMNETTYRGEFTVTVVNSTTFTYTLPTTASSPATGNIGWRYGRQTHLDKHYDFITVNYPTYPILYQPGDIIGSCVEADQADSSNMTFKTPGTTTFNTGIYNQFQKDQVRYTNAALTAIGLGGQVATWAISHNLSNLNLNGQTLDSGAAGNSSGLANVDIVSYFGGVLSIDHYLSDTYRYSDATTYWSRYSSDLDKIHTAFPSCKIMISEWGYHTTTDTGNGEQLGMFEQMMKVFRSKPYILGVSIWNHLGQTQSSIFTDSSGTIRPMERFTWKAVQRAFHTGNASSGGRKRL